MPPTDDDMHGRPPPKADGGRADRDQVMREVAERDPLVRAIANAATEAGCDREETLVMMVAEMHKRHVRVAEIAEQALALRGPESAVVGMDGKKIALAEVDPVGDVARAQGQAITLIGSLLNVHREDDMGLRSGPVQYASLVAEAVTKLVKGSLRETDIQ